MQAVCKGQGWRNREKRAASRWWHPAAQGRAREGSRCSVHHLSCRPCLLQSPTPTHAVPHSCVHPPPAGVARPRLRRRPHLPTLPADAGQLRLRGRARHWRAPRHRERPYVLLPAAGRPSGDCWQRACVLGSGVVVPIYAPPASGCRLARAAVRGPGEQRPMQQAFELLWAQHQGRAAPWRDLAGR